MQKRKRSAAIAEPEDGGTTSVARRRSSHSEAEGRWRPGFIKRVHIENFMRHQNFTVEFGPNVTFISGKNGSGKSATLQALQCCLGVRAKAMGRGSSLKGFIRRGCNSALVMVTLSNEGDERDAYKRDVYGSQITVERRIDTKGAGGFVIRDERGKKIGHSKWELDRLLDYLNLMVSNPCVVTTQDIARSFLSNDTNDQSRYKLFMQATMLEQVKQNLTSTNLNIQKMEDIRDAKFKDLEKSEKELAVVKKQLDHVRQIERHVQLERDCEGVLVWMEVKELETKLDQLKVKLFEKVPKYTEMFTNNLAAAKAALDELETNRQKRFDEVDARASRGEEIKATEQQLKESMRKLTKQEATQKQNLVKLKRHKSELEEEKRDLEQSLRESDNAVDLTSTQMIEDNHNQKINEAKLALEQVRQEEMEIKHDLGLKVDARDRVEANLNERSDNIHRLNEAINECRRDLGALGPQGRRAANTVSPDLFGDKYSRLVQQIGANINQFHRPPIGPLGVHLELPDQFWGRAMEASLGGSYSQFILHDEHDLQVFRNCARNIGMRYPPSTFITSFDRRRIRVPDRALPPRNFTTVASVIRINHPTFSDVIWNVLIDNFRIEATLLVKDMEEGNIAIFKNAATPARRAYTADCRLLEVKGRTEINRQIRGIRGSSRLMVAGRDMREERRGIENELQQFQQAKQALQTECQDLQGQEKSLSQTCLAYESKLNAIIQTKIQLESEVQRQYESMKDALDEAVGAAGDGGADLEAEIKNTEIKIDLDKTQINSVEEMISQIQSEMDLLKAQMSNLEKKKHELAEEGEQMVLNAHVLDDEVEKAQMKVDEVKEKFQQLTRKKASLQKDLDERQPQCDEKVKAAEQVCKSEELKASLEALGTVIEIDSEKMRIEDRKVVEDLLKKLRANIKTLEQECGSLEELELKHRIADRQHKRQKSIFKSINEPFELMAEGLHMRWGKFRAMRKTSQQVVNFAFGGFMNKRGHAGKMTFNHKEGSLKITVRLAQGGGLAGQKVNDMKSLSGGERSLSTLAFVLSLGSQCESPFRAADEFDVFMDAVNRKVSLRVLLNFAVDFPSQQMILLTPQDLSQVEEIKEEIKENPNYHSKFIKLIRMPNS